MVFERKNKVRSLIEVYSVIVKRKRFKSMRDAYRSKKLDLSYRTFVYIINEMQSEGLLQVEKSGGFGKGVRLSIAKIRANKITAKIKQLRGVLGTELQKVVSP